MTILQKMCQYLLLWDGYFDGIAELPKVRMNSLAPEI